VRVLVVEDEGNGTVALSVGVIEGRVRLRTGTLYGALDRLTTEGLIVGDREEIVDGRLRRYYRLTDDGAALLDAEAERLQRNAAAARARLRDRAARRAVPGFTVTGRRTSCEIEFGHSTRSIRSEQKRSYRQQCSATHGCLATCLNLVAKNLRRRDRAMA
jgi:DNA-binding MarR family transcriptional regulator